MSNQQKRTFRILLSIAIVLAVALAAVLIYKSRSAAAAEEAEAQAQADAVITQEQEYNALSYYNSSATLSFTLDEAGSWVWADDPTFPLNQTTVTAIVDLLTSLTPQQTITEGDTLEAYGLDDPELTIWLHQAAGTVSAVDENGQLTTVEVKEQALRFVIGRAEGDFFYTCEYAGDCYLVSRFLLETVLAASPDTLVTRQPANLAGAALSDILIEAPQGDIHVTARYTERVLPNNDIETDADGNIVYDTAVTLNGEEADAELLTTLTTRLNALTVSGDLTDAWTVPEGETPRWRIVLTTVGGSTRELAAYRLDAFSDALAVDGVAIHYAHEEAIDLILADLLD